MIAQRALLIAIAGVKNSDSRESRQTLTIYIRDRVVQGALKLILEPIFEADFQSGSYGYRPKRTAHQAVNRVPQAIVGSKTRIIDIDLRAYLDTYKQCSYG
jgi:retron-type reverse transcriptase